jgi:AAA+ ATPase superfamily predicted ATPase
MKEFLPLYEFVLFYNTCFTYNSTQRLKTFLTKNELDSTSFSEFEQVFQTRRILHPLPKNCGEKPDLTVLSKQESILLFSFISDIFLFLNSSPVGAFSQKSLRDKAPILEQVDTSFF